MSRKKNIALLQDCLGDGGAEKVVINLASGVKALGHDAHIICIQSFIEHYIPEGTNIHSLGYKKNVRLKTTKDIDALQEEFTQLIDSLEEKHGKFDLFLANTDITNYLLTHSKFNPKYFIVHTNIEFGAGLSQFSYNPVKYWRQARITKVLNNKNLIGVSKGVIDCVLKSKRIKPASTKTIYNPFDFEQIRSLANQEDKDIPTQPYIVHAARITKQKRHDILFQAFKEVPQHYKLVLLSNNAEKLHELAEKYEIRDRIITPGFKANPYPWYKHAKLMVLSSDFEGLPTVLIESLICGTPVVSTNCDYGPREILTDELSEYLCPTRDPHKLTQVINKALSHYPDISNISIFDKVKADKVIQQYLDLAN